MKLESRVFTEDCRMNLLGVNQARRRWRVERIGGGEVGGGGVVLAEIMTSQKNLHPLEEWLQSSAECPEE